MTKYDKIYMVLSMASKQIITYMIDRLVDFKLIEAAYLEKNNNEEDNLYLHVIIKKDKKDLFSKYIKNLFEEMFELTYYKDIESFYDFHNYYLKFNDDLRVFLLIDIDNYSMLKNSISIYDPDKLLSVGDHNISSKIIGETLNEISYLLDIFCTAYRIKDLVKAMRILNYVNKYLLRVLNYMYLPNKVYHNYRECLNLLPETIKNDCIKIVKKIKIDSLLECSKMMLIVLDEQIYKVSIDVASFVNMDFYYSVKRSIFAFC